MAFEELITWSNQEVRPDWQRDALRRLAATGELSEEDLSDLIDSAVTESALRIGWRPVFPVCAAGVLCAFLWIGFRIGRAIGLSFVQRN
ncbi:hypothetical protein [Litoreibacter ascidiaceicola]|uniref:hypothetical protein n=1 Tax=Litoreibacter ascidiaceicola TaxID=1486859 RepID=UPI00111471C4|nr:hypothetical protein [Litoreibacter ascidiaceicola]